MCWNINAQLTPWQELFRMDADVALLQGVKAIPKELPENVAIAPNGLGEPWEAEWFRRVLPKDGEAFVAISMYARWIRPHVSTRSSWKVGYADG